MSATSGPLLLVNGPALTQETFDQFRALIQEKTGIHMRNGKQILIANRLRKRLASLKLRVYTPRIVAEQAAKAAGARGLLAGGTGTSGPLRTSSLRQSLAWRGWRGTDIMSNGRVYVARRWYAE